MKRALAPLLLALVSFPALGELSGTWTGRISAPGKLQLHLQYEESDLSTSFPLEQFDGLPAGAVDGAKSREVNFRLVRDAGTFHLHGAFELGRGSGHFRFEPSLSFLQDLAALDVDVPKKRSRSTEDTLLTLAIFDVTLGFVRELRDLGIDDLSMDQLTALRIHGASPAFIRELRNLGYQDLSADEVVNLRIHGATAEFIRELAKDGYRPEPDELVTLRIHGVKPAFVRELRALGYTQLSTEDLVSLRIHGVTTEYVGELKKLGYDRIDPEDLTSLKIHGVSTELIRALHEAGYQRVPVEKLIELKIHGVDAVFVRALKKEH